MRRSKRTSKPIFAQKHRKFINYNEKCLQWGMSGIRLLGRFSITRRRTWFFKLWFKWYYKRYYRVKRKRVDYTRVGAAHFRKYGRGKTWKRTRRTFYWFRARRAVPVLHKSNKSRMGKGRGKLYSWISHVKAGTILTEFAYYKKRLSDYFALKILCERLPCKAQYIVSENLNQITPFNGRYNNIRYFNKLDFMYVHKFKTGSIFAWRLRNKNYSI